MVSFPKSSTWCPTAHVPLSRMWLKEWKDLLIWVSITMSNAKHTPMKIGTKLRRALTKSMYLPCSLKKEILTLPPLKSSIHVSNPSNLPRISTTAMYNAIQQTNHQVSSTTAIPQANKKTYYTAKPVTIGSVSCMNNWVRKLSLSSWGDSSN